MRLPDEVQEIAGRGERWAAWVAGVPGVARTLLADWQLTADGDGWAGERSLVCPVRTADGAAAVLKIAFGDEEGHHAHLALRHWRGRGAARLLRADPHRGALLVERLHRRDLTGLPDVDGCEVVAGLYGRLHVPAPPTVALLSRWAAGWAERLSALPRSAAVPRRLVEQARSIAGDLAGDAATDGILVHGNLHFAQVLAADREPWLSVGPRPLSGDPHFEPAPMLWHRRGELLGSGDVRDTVRRRFHTLVDTAWLDEDRARHWVVLRTVAAAVEELTAPGTSRERITTAVAVAKAVQD